MAAELKVGDMVAGKNNSYQVVRGWTSQQYKFLLLKCVDFYDQDDLGDGIACTQLGQEILVSNHCAQWMPRL